MSNADDAVAILTGIATLTATSRRRDRWRTIDDDLTRADARLWRCPTCGGWRYSLKPCRTCQET